MDLHHVVVIVVVEVAALGVAVVLRAAMVLGQQGFSWSWWCASPSPSPQSLNDSSKASDVNSSPEARALNDTYLDTFTGRTWTCAQTCPAAQMASLSGRL
ncbi:hypothetical protein ACOMHN_011232 [Nucella lapillus]